MPEHSSYQGFKIWLAQMVPVERDFLHIVIGLCAVLAAILLSRPPRRAVVWVRAFGLVALLAVTMELLDMRDDIRTFGHWRWQASSADIARTLLFPALAVLASGLRRRFRRS